MEERNRVRKARWRERNGRGRRVYLHVSVYDLSCSLNEIMSWSDARDNVGGKSCLIYRRPERECNLISKSRYAGVRCISLCKQQ